MSARPCVMDASILIAFGKAGRLDVLGKVTGLAPRITPRIREELRSPAIKRAVEDAILQGTLQIVELDSDDLPAMRLLADWSSVVDYGEAECIAVALARGWIVGIEDLDARRRLDRKAGKGHWVNAANLLIDAVKSGTMPLVDAETIFGSLDSFSAYKKAGIVSLVQLDPTLK